MLNRTVAPKINPIHCKRLVLPQPTTLSNGIELWTVSGGKDDLCRISFFCAGGELQELKPLVAILSALMMYKGNRHKNSFDISEAFDFCGAFHSTNTYNHFTENAFSCLNKNFEEIASLFVDCFIEPTFPRESWRASRLDLQKVLRCRFKTRLIWQPLRCASCATAVSTHWADQFPSPKYAASLELIWSISIVCIIWLAEQNLCYLAMLTTKLLIACSAHSGLCPSMPHKSYQSHCLIVHPPRCSRWSTAKVQCNHQ